MYLPSGQEGGTWSAKIRAGDSRGPPAAFTWSRDHDDQAAISTPTDREEENGGKGLDEADVDVIARADLRVHKLAGPGRPRGSVQSKTCTTEHAHGSEDERPRLSVAKAFQPAV